MSFDCELAGLCIRPFQLKIVMEKNLSNHFEYIVDFMSLGNQQLMYLDEKKNVKFIYEKDILVKPMFLSDSLTIKGDTYYFLMTKIPDTYCTTLRGNIYAENLQISIISKDCKI